MVHKMKKACRFANLNPFDSLILMHGINHCVDAGDDEQLPKIYTSVVV